MTYRFIYARHLIWRNDFAPHNALIYVGRNILKDLSQDFDSASLNGVRFIYWHPTACNQTSKPQMRRCVVNRYCFVNGHHQSNSCFIIHFWPQWKYYMRTPCSNLFLYLARNLTHVMPYGGGQSTHLLHFLDIYTFCARVIKIADNKMLGLVILLFTNRNA